MRIGHGYDVHRIEYAESSSGLVICGVRIACPYTVVAYSDGDIPIHALCDAMLGACALGDIGKWFPDTDQRWQGANSRTLLKACKEKIQEQGYKLGNADITIIAQSPKMAPHIIDMRENLAKDLGVAFDQISVKATTHEGVDAVGEKRAIAAHAVVLLERYA